MPWNLLILPLIAGFILLTKCRFFKFRQQRLDQQRLIFETILFSILLTLSVYVLRIFLELIPWLRNIIILIHNQLPIKSAFTGTSLAVLFISLSITGISYLFDKKKFIKIAIKHVGNHFEQMLKESFDRVDLLQFTLKNDKVYIAWIRELPIPGPYGYIRVTPVLSGYRSKDNKELRLTTEYASVLKEFYDEMRAQYDQKEAEKRKSKKRRFRNPKPDRPEKEIEREFMGKLQIDFILTLSEIISVGFYDDKKYDLFNPITIKEVDEDEDSSTTSLKSRFKNFFNKKK